MYLSFFKHFCLYEVKICCIYLSPKINIFYNLVIQAVCLQILMFFLRNHQNEIKNRYDSIISDFKVRAQTLRAFKLSLDLSYELFFELVGNIMKIYLVKAYLDLRKEIGPSALLTTRSTAQKMAQFPNTPEYIGMLNQAISTVNQSLKNCFDLYNNI